MYFLLAQILFALWAVGFAHFQSPCIKAMREYVTLGNPYTGPFHKRGAMLTCFISVFLSALLFGVSGWVETAFSAPAFFCIYKILFDGIIGEEVYEDFFYIGTTAKQDRWINTHFPHDKPGEVKFFLCLIVLLFTNITYYLI